MGKLHVRACKAIAIGKATLDTTQHHIQSAHSHQRLYSAPEITLKQHLSRTHHTLTTHKRLISS
jgi:hypothetical protein